MVDGKYITPESEAIQKVLDVVPLLYDFFDEDISIAVGDTEKYLYNTGVGTMDIKYELGSPIPQTGSARNTLNTGKPCSAQIPATVYGFPFKAYSVPIRENGKVVGVLCLAKSLAKGDQLSKTASNLSRNMDEMMGVVSDMANSVQELVDVIGTANEMMESTVKTAESTTEILSFISSISNKTKLLGLNASIEAARAGEAGRGFSVVASEIGKMSLSTTESVQKISDILGNLVAANKEVQEKLSTANTSFTEQAAAIQQIVASLSELQDTTAALSALAQKL